MISNFRFDKGDGNDMKYRPIGMPLSQVGLTTNETHCDVGNKTTDVLTAS